MTISLNHARFAPESVPSTRSLTLVIGVAGSAADRVRLSELVDEDVLVLLVSSPDDVPEVLHGVSAPATAHPAATGDSVVMLPQLRIDSDRRVASWFGNEVSLTPLEYDLLTCLLSSPGRMWSFEKLYKAVWRSTYLGNRAEIHSLVKRLRAKLKRLTESVVIEAVRGIGFRLVLPAQ